MRMYGRLSAVAVAAAAAVQVGAVRAGGRVAFHADAECAVDAAQVPAAAFGTDYASRFQVGYRAVDFKFVLAFFAGKSIYRHNFTSLFLFSLFRSGQLFGKVLHDGPAGDDADEHVLVVDNRDEVLIHSFVEQLLIGCGDAGRRRTVQP